MGEKIVMIGAGSAMFTRGIICDIIQRGWQTEIVLVDINPEVLQVVEKLARKMIEAKKASIRLSATTDRREALPGATAVITTIGIGGRQAWEQDIFTLRKYGIYVTCGDSIGPAGASNAMRMIPTMVDIAKDIVELAPGALFFNYGNPMSAVCRAVRIATGAEIVGLCHGVFHVAKHLAAVLGVDRSQLTYTAVGINHLTWFTEIRADGKDMMTRLKRIAYEKQTQDPTLSCLGASFLEDGSNNEETQFDENPFSWQLLHTLGAFPSAMDRHVTEFFPEMFARKKSYYGKTLGVDAYSFENTIAYGNIIHQMAVDAASMVDPLGPEYYEPVCGEHEQVLDMLESIRTDAGRIYSANLPNAGQVPNLQQDAVIEAPAVADGSGMRAIIQKPLSAGLATPVATHLAWIEIVVEAALEKSREKFIQAVFLSGCVDSLETATKLADELLIGQAKHLPQFDLLK